MSGVIDVAIVLCAVFVGLSCLCSFINEYIASMFRLRGSKLYLGILNLVIDPALAEAVYANPLVQSAANTKDGVRRPSKLSRPSYIAARSFSLAFWQALQKCAELPPTAAAAKLVDTPTALLNDLSARVNAMAGTHEPLSRSLASLLNQANGSYEDLLKATDAWFGAQMDRVSGWYRRQAQLILIAISLVVVLLTGVDSLEIAKRLYTDNTLRVVAADTITKTLPQSNTTDPKKRDESIAAVRSAVDQLFATTNLGEFVHPINPGGSWLQFSAHLPGMLLTFLALSLGAPFWFDALCGLTNTRLAGQKPTQQSSESS